MNTSQLMELQSKRGAKTIGADTITKTFDKVLTECRRNIQDNSDQYRELDPMGKREVIKQLILSYVMANKPLVEGYTDSEGNSDTIRLVDKLVEDITDYGILTAAMQDSAIYEIRGNGKEIKIEREGKIEDLKDKDGNIISFDNLAQQEIVIRKMLGDVRLTPKDALVTGRTIEGYRIAAVHNSAISPDPNDPSAPIYHAFVLRKFRKSKLRLSDIIRFGTMSDGMGKLIAIAPRGGLTFVTCGPTASGKTTTNNAALQEVPDNVRVVLLQNPSEIDLRHKDATGTIINDVIHLEAKDKDNPSPSDPTMDNLMAHTLRLSPTMVCLGEVRTNKEFANGMMIMSAGHPLNVTYHAEDAEGSVGRFLTAYMADSGETIDTALPNLTRLLNLIIIQKIMKDGSRKILQITEVIGVDPNNSNKPWLNDLYRFIPEGEPEYDEEGNVKKIPGVHKRVGKLSERTITKLRLEGIKLSEFEYLTRQVSPDEVETYTGKIN